jgi:hypothetical protein
MILKENEMDKSDFPKTHILKNHEIREPRTEEDQPAWGVPTTRGGTKQLRWTTDYIKPSF